MDPQQLSIDPWEKLKQAMGGVGQSVGDRWKSLMEPVANAGEDVSNSPLGLAAMLLVPGRAGIKQLKLPMSTPRMETPVPDWFHARVLRDSEAAAAKLANQGKLMELLKKLGVR